MQAISQLLYQRGLCEPMIVFLCGYNSIATLGFREDFLHIFSAETMVVRERHQAGIGMQFPDMCH